MCDHSDIHLRINSVTIKVELDMFYHVLVFNIFHTGQKTY